MGILDKKAVHINIIAAIAISLISTIYFYPMHSESIFRLSLGVIAFGIVSLIIENIQYSLIGILSGLFTFIARTAIEMMMSVPIKQALLNHFPTIIFYIIFGIVLQTLLKESYKDYPRKFIPILLLAEMIANIVESIIRENINITVILTICVSALIRTSVTTALWSIIQYQKIFILTKSHQERYAQLNQVVSDIYAEIFYLKKSSGDIENVMTKSYELYNDTNNSENVRKKALNIAKDIHEIRKDYYRVIKGFDSLVTENKTKEKLKINTIFAIIENNINRVIQSDNKNIKLEFKYDYNCEVSRFYDLFVVLNNLISNAIDACENTGIIKITEKNIDNNIIFSVEDNGEGIDEDTIPFIFNAGFTTKFNEATGNSSAGIGLCHIKNIIDDLGGKIEVKSDIQGTMFTIIFPITSIQ